MIKKRSHEIYGFDGIRAIAVLIVIAGHANITHPLLAQKYPALYGMLAPTRGVDIFFVLSGFLITTLLLNEYSRYGSVSLYNFCVRRAFRILPVYYLFLAMVILVSLVGRTDFSWGGVPLLLINFFNYAPRTYRGSIDGHIWSLAVEWQYYLVWPVLFAALASRRLALLGIIAFTVAISAAIYTAIPARGYFNYGTWLLPAVTPIAIGSAAAILIGTRKIHWFFVALGAVLYAIPAIHGVRYGFGPAIMATGIALFVAWVFTNQTSIPVKILEFPPLKYIGVLSYGLYIWHVFLMGTGPGRLEGETWPPDQATGFVLLLLIAPLSYHGFEIPVQALRERFLVRREKKHSSTLPGSQVEIVRHDCRTGYSSR